MNEFCLVWFETPGHWLVAFETGETKIVKGTVTEAANTALEMANAAEADFDVVDSEYSYYRYCRSESE